MSFRSRASIDANSEKGLILLNSVAGTPLVATGLSLTNAQPIHVAIVDASGSQVVPAAATGTSDVNVKQVNGATVNVGTGTAGTGTQRVAVASDSSITVNAGTNLNTSALALESGGNLDDIDAALDNIVAQATTTSGLKGLTAFGAVTTNAPSYTTAKSDALSLTTGGALRSDVTTIAGTAPSTAGKLDVKGADGDVFVRNATAGNFLANVTLQTQTDTVMVGGINIREINAVTPLMGNGVTGTGSLRVTIASDNTAFAVKEQSSTAAITSVASSASSVNLLASNVNRRAATFYNDSTQILYLKLGATASSSSYTVQMAAGSYYEFPQPCYTGAVDGLWASANGNVRITEVTT